MKVCFISPSLFSGIGRYTKRISDQLSKNNIDVFTITPELLNKKSAFYNFLNVIKTYSLIKKIKPDVVHVQYDISHYKLFSFPLWFILNLIKKKIRLVITFHEVKRDTDKLGFLGRIYYQFVSNLFSQIHLHTKESEKILISKCRVNKNKIRIISHGTYVFEYKDDLRKDLINKFKLKRKSVILYFGFIHVDKGIEYLLEASGILNDKGFLKDKVVLIAGKIKEREGIFKIFEKQDKEYFQNLISLRDNLNLSKNVKFIGHIDDKYVYSLFKLSKLIVMPYTNVDQSGVLNIALASHKPVIASNIGGLKETLKEAGILVPKKNPYAIAEKIIQLTKNKKLYNQIVEKYKEIDKKQNTRVITKILIKQYNELLGDGK